MDEKSMFWDGTDVGDALAVAPYDETEFDDFFELALRSFENIGVVIGVDNEFVTTLTGGNTTVTVDTGGALVKGKGYWGETSSKTLTPTVPGGVRWDYVVIRTLWGGVVAPKTVRIELHEGVVGGGAPPSLTQNDGVEWEIPIAYYKNTNGVLSDLTDAREWVGHVVSDTNNSGITDVVELAHEAAVPAAGVGTGMRFKADTDANKPRLLGRLAMLWRDVTDATRQSEFQLWLDRNGTDILAGVIRAPDDITGYVDGNDRGEGSVDLQNDRGGATQVASGEAATISGGRNNTASGDKSVVCGGATNQATGTESTVGGGSANVASATTSTIGGGTLNEADSQGATVAGGDRNDAKANYAAIGGGYENAVTDIYGTVAGGYQNEVQQDHGAIGGGIQNIVSGGYGAIPGGYENEASGDLSVAMGRGAVADKFGQVAQENGYFAAAGDAQGTIQIVARKSVTHSDANWYELFLDGAAARMTIPADSIWTFEILVSATTQGGGAGMDVASYHIIGIIENDNGVTALPSAATITVIHEDDANWDVRINAITCAANDALCIEVQDSGASGATVRWVATIRTSEVTYP